MTKFQKGDVIRRMRTNGSSTVKIGGLFEVDCVSTATGWIFLKGVDALKGDYNPNFFELVYRPTESQLCNSCQNYKAKKKMVKKTVEVEQWANVYEDRGPYIHETEEDANAVAMSDRIACVKLTGSYEIEVEEEGEE